MDFLRENKYIIILIYVLIWLIISCITLFLYKADKVKAQRHQWRIKEATLLLFPWIMGSIGGILGVFVLRHKTKHWYFVINNILALIVHNILLILLVIL